MIFRRISAYEQERRQVESFGRTTRVGQRGFANFCQQGPCTVAASPLLQSFKLEIRAGFLIFERRLCFLVLFVCFFFHA